jgi:hypothetical protein
VCVARTQANIDALAGEARLRGLSSDDFREALAALIGDSAGSRRRTSPRLIKA